MTSIQAIVPMQGPWVLVVAGVSPLGRRQAERAVAAALARSQNVALLDGHVPPILPGELGLDAPELERLTVFSFGPEERRALAFRMTQSKHSGHRESAWQKLRRRIGTMLRPVSVWRLSQGAIRTLSTGNAPERIICCDEVGVTTAWKASRIWPEALVGGP